MLKFLFFGSIFLQSIFASSSISQFRLIIDDICKKSSKQGFDKYIVLNRDSISKKISKLKLPGRVFDFTRNIDLLRAILFYDLNYDVNDFNFDLFLSKSPPLLQYSRELLRCSLEIRKNLATLRPPKNYTMAQLVHSEQKSKAHIWKLVLLIEMRNPPIDDECQVVFKQQIYLLDYLYYNEYKTYYDQALRNRLAEKFLYCAFVETVYSKSISFKDIETEDIPCTHQELLAKGKMVFRAIMGELDKQRVKRPQTADEWLNIETQLKTCFNSLIALEEKIIAGAYKLESTMKMKPEISFICSGLTTKIRIFLVVSNPDLPPLFSTHTIYTGSRIMLIYLSDCYPQIPKFIDSLEKHVNITYILGGSKDLTKLNKEIERLFHLCQKN